MCIYIYIYIYIYIKLNGTSIIRHRGVIVQHDSMVELFGSSGFFRDTTTLLYDVCKVPDLFRKCAANTIPE